MDSRKKVFLLIVVLFIIVTSYVIYQNMYFVKPGDYSGIEAIGIIDDSLCEDYNDNVIYEGELIEDKKSHGQDMLEYVENMGYINDIYYFSAEKNNTINSESIIEGLEWMKAQGIKRVNISLSSKKKSKDLVEWIANNSDIRIFCSYNNIINTYDYPAMIDGTISSGFNEKVNYKTSDVVYKTNNIVVFNKGIHYYKGNSYLSVCTMLNYKE